MNEKILAVAVVLVFACVAVSEAYAYHANYSDKLDGQDITKSYATLTSDGLSQNVTVSGETILFGSSHTLSVNYDDYMDRNCFINLAVSGVGEGNIVKISFVQEYSSTSKTFTGSAKAGSDGIAVISGFGPVEDGSFTVFGTVTGGSSNEEVLSLRFTAYPQL